MARTADLGRTSARASETTDLRRVWLLRVAALMLALIAYSVGRAWILAIVRLPPVPGGLSSLTVILTVFSLCHAWYSIGGRLTAIFFAISAAVSWALEQAGVVTGLVYGGYHYTDYLGAKLGDVPVLIPLAWFMMIYPSYVIGNLVLARRAAGTPAGLRWLIGLAAASALVMTLWDLVIDPILSGPDVRAWVWESGGQYFGVPIQNFFGWFVTTFIAYGLFRAIEQRACGEAAEGGGAFARLGPGPESRIRPEPEPWTVVAMPVLAYGLMLVGDLASGVTPAGIFVIGPIVMGVPFALGMWRVFELRRAEAGRSGPGRSERADMGLHEAVPADAGLELVRD